MGLASMAAIFLIYNVIDRASSAFYVKRYHSLHSTPRRGSNAGNYSIPNCTLALANRHSCV